MPALRFRHAAVLACALLSAICGVALAQPSDASGPAWLREAVRSDDFRESATTFTLMRPLAEAASTSSPLASAPVQRQPSGALSGKVVFAMGGHGWTYHYDTGLWFTQRGVTHRIVEDLANADQLALFVRLLWQSGATVVPMRPVGRQPVERVVDNNDRHAAFFGEWAPGASELAHHQRFHHTPYLVARAALRETAVARFRPILPRAGDYPVYAWARDGADRVNQLYRVVHAGGVTEARVDHRRVGKGWVLLGTFPFTPGDDGYVEVSNHVLDPYEADGSSVVVADAIRFGNGMGDVNRGGGISGYPREDEASIYWFERALPALADRRLYTVPGDDAAATVGAPPRVAAYMNRESQGRFFDRVLISFHSNALRGASRGVVALFNQNPSQRPTYQEELAVEMGTRLEDELVSAPSIREPVFARRSRITYSGINFGELRRDYLQNEMCATIVEVAFHDNAEDAVFLRDPNSRLDMARATVRGLLNWLNAMDPSSPPARLMPAPPRLASVGSGPDGSIRVRWEPADGGRFAGDPPDGFHVRVLGSDGLLSRTLTVDESARTADVSGISTGTTALVNVVAFNAGGESLPSRTMPVRIGDGRGGVLLVDGLTTVDETLNTVQRADGGLGSAWGPAGEFVRVFPVSIASAEHLLAAADALSSAGLSFGACDAPAFETGDAAPSRRGTVFWLAGCQSPAEGGITTASRERLRTHVRNGGALWINGAHIAGALGASDAAAVGRPTRSSRAFLREVARAEFVTTVPAAGPFSPGGRLRPPSPYYSLRHIDSVRPVGSSAASDPSDALDPHPGSALVGPKPSAGRTGGRVVFSTIPVETMPSREETYALVGRVLGLLGVRIGNDNAP